MRWGLPILLLAGLASCGAVFPSYRNTEQPITSLATFDPAAYAGRWVEVARYPVPFQSGCVATSATYGVPDGATLSVLNACRTATGEVRTIAGSAELVGPGRLEVRLNGVPFAADYWVLWADAGYRTAVVGVPSGRAAWILNRTPEIPDDRLQAALEVLRFNGYDTDALIFGQENAP